MTYAILIKTADCGCGPNGPCSQHAVSDRRLAALKGASRLIQAQPVPQHRRWVYWKGWWRWIP